MKTGTGVLTLSKRLFKIAGPVKGLLTVSTLASIIGNISHIGLLASAAMLILLCAGQSSAGSPWFWGAAMFLCAGGIFSCRYIEGYVSHAAAYKLLAMMRVNFFKTIGRLAPARLMDRQKGDILSIAVADIETIEFFFAHTIGPLFTVFLLPLITLFAAGKNHILFAAALLPVYIIISILLPMTAIKTGRNIGRNYRAAIGELKTLILESITSLRDIQIFGFGKRRAEMVGEKTREINRAAHILTLHRQMVTSAPVFFVYLARILVVAVASYLVIRGMGNPGGIILLSFVVSASFSSTQSLTMVISNLLETYAAAERLFILEDAEPEVVEAENPVELGPIERIDFDHVGFRYRSEGEEILKDLNLSIRRGDRIGVAGESGIGKSTIIRLLLRFWEPTSGEIRINGIPLKRISLRSLRSRIVLLEQDTFIFNDTIAANIALGRPEASREEIEASAKRAHIHDFIQTLPEGYDTQLGEFGGRLSGGEKQRIGIARAMLPDPDILVLDEPTSNLDVLGEKGILKTLEDEYGDKTLLIVSHRMSTLSGCTRLLRMKEGKL
ncbi:MAG: ABC transporter ATP-binding protein/permease, partial [Treponema sp.]|nr:ABC transporter ATP-binding protein/permease [Treponema sp.]